MKANAESLHRHVGLLAQHASGGWPVAQPCADNLDGLILLPLPQATIGKLYLVDLAGSERLKKSKSTGLQAQQAASINLSLTTMVCVRASACVHPCVRVHLLKCRPGLLYVHS